MTTTSEQPTNEPPKRVRDAIDAAIEHRKGALLALAAEGEQAVERRTCKQLVPYTGGANGISVPGTRPTVAVGFVECGALIEEGPCRVVVQTAPIKYEACGESRLHSEHDEDGHDYDGYVCTADPPHEQQEAP